MPLTEFDLEKVRAHRSAIVAPTGLSTFWDRSLEQARAEGSAPSFDAVATGLAVLDTYDVTLPGFAGEPVRAWLHLPAGPKRPLPAVVQYIGYGGGRGLAHENMFWAVAGYAHLVVDTRGQGSAGAVGDTADPNPGRPETAGVLTRGLLDADTYYYRRVFTDAVRAVDAVRQHPDVDVDRIAVVGASQGGAIALAAGALAGGVAAALVDVPFLCDVRRAVHLVATQPYRELATYLAAHRDHVEQAFATLAHFDGAVLAGLGRCPALFSVGLMDDICPPSTVYAAHNAWGGSKAMAEYEFNGHEGGGPFHQVRQLDWLRDVLGSAGEGGDRDRPDPDVASEDATGVRFDGQLPRGQS